MFSRLQHDTGAVYFPDKWTSEVKQILLNVYGDKCLKEDKSFEVYGFSYPTEAILILSYVKLNSKYEAPVTLFLSSDLNDSMEAKKVMDDMVDAAGVFFDDYFSKVDSLTSEDEIFEDYVHDWDEAEFSNHKIYYKISRENIGLTIQANILLGE